MTDVELTNSEEFKWVLEWFLEIGWPPTVGLFTNLAQDRGWDSMDENDFAVSASQKFACSIPEEGKQMQHAGTVRDLVLMIVTARAKAKAALEASATPVSEPVPTE